MSGDYGHALALATARNKTALSPRDRALVDEARGMAMIGLGRQAEAVSAFEAAAREYDAAGDRSGGARALYGEAIALRAAAQCQDAARAFQRYAAFERTVAPEEAAMAARYALDCPGVARNK
jgi:hypothetical protein